MTQTWWPNMNTFCAAIVASLLLINPVFAQEPEQKPLDKPFVQQPKLSGIETGTVGIFADWKPNKRGTHDIIVVNRSDESVTLDYGYGNPDCYLEAKNEDGIWERATLEVFHMCGTGLGRYKLKPGFFSVGMFGMPDYGNARKTILERQIKENQAYMNLANMTKETRKTKLAETKQLQSQLAELEEHFEEREVRIRAYGQNVKAVSNSSKAVIDVRVIAAAKCDSLAIQTASLARLESIIMGEEVIDSVPFDPVHVAIRSLGREGHSIEKSATILKRVIAESKDEKLVDIATRLLAAKPFK